MQVFINKLWVTYPLFEVGLLFLGAMSIHQGLNISRSSGSQSWSGNVPYLESAGSAPTTRRLMGPPRACGNTWMRVSFKTSPIRYPRYSDRFCVDLGSTDGVPRWTPNNCPVGDGTQTTSLPLFQKCDQICGKEAWRKSECHSPLCPSSSWNARTWFS